MPKTLKKSKAAAKTPRVIKAQPKKNLYSSRAIFVKTLVLFAIVVAVASVWGWWRFIYTSPKNVFWGSINNALQTTSLQHQLEQEDNGALNKQNTTLITTPKQIVAGTNYVEQSGPGGYVLNTDLVGTPTVDYVKYNSIKTDQKNEKGEAIDYKNILGLWSKNEAPDKQTNGQLYNQSVIGLVPFANLSSSQRSHIKSLMNSKKIYTIDYKSVVRSTKNGRPVYTYKVALSIEGYVSVLKAYAGMVGLNQLDSVDPSSYKDRPPVSFSLSADVWSHQVKSIEYENGRKDIYTSFGAIIDGIKEPSKTVPIEEFQQRIQATQ